MIRAGGFRSADPRATPSAKSKAWLRINPATAFVELFRYATTKPDPGWVVSLWWCFGWVAVLLVVAVLLYRRFDRVFADLL